MVRVAGVEPASQPWEGYIMAVIRHPLGLIYIWSHLPEPSSLTLLWDISLQCSMQASARFSR